MPSFTAAEVFLDASTTAPELGTRPIDPDVIARCFNVALRDLVQEVVDVDDERLAAEYTVPAAVVAADPVDLTDDGTGTGKREWLAIGYIDWRDASGEGFEVWLGTIEARNRIAADADGWVAGYLDDQLRRLRKVTGWSGVQTLAVYGVLVPPAATLANLRTQAYDYPTSLRTALRWELAVLLAPYAGVQDRHLLERWEARRMEARERLLGDAGGHVRSRVDALILQSEV